MTLKDYIEHLNKIVENNPKALDMKVVTGDGNGSRIEEVWWEPEISYWDNDQMIVGVSQYETQKDHWNIEECVKVIGVG